MIEFDCSCERKHHSAPLESYTVGENAIEQLPKILEKYNSVYMVCDENTYKAAGTRAEELLKKANKFSHKLVLPDGCLPDGETIGNIIIHLADPKAESDIFAKCPNPEFILAVGSGTINDSCRLVSYRTGIPYGILGTAPSMDGYASAGSPTLFDGTKATIKCTTPKYIIADTNIMKDAPFDMLLAGIGDMFGKYTGLLDWELSHYMTGEYFCEKIAGDVLEATNLCLENGYKIADRNPDTVKNIMDGFLVTGLGMAYTGNSRPASGSEHIIAHAWELEDVENGRKPNLHGLEVCEATRIIAGMYLILYNETDEGYLKKLIEKYVVYFEKVEEFCIKMNVPSPVKDRERILKSVERALVLRDRYTVLFYLRDKNILTDYASKAVDDFLKRI